MHMRLLSGVVVVLMAAGCGQKGPLYLSDNPPPGYKTPKTDTYKPVPYPKDMEREGASGK